MSTAPPRIVMTFPLALGVAGGGTVGCVQLSRALRAAGTPVTLLTVSAPGAGRRLLRRPAPDPAWLGGAEEQALRDAGVEVQRVAPHRLHAFADGLAVRRALARHLATRGADALLGFHHELAFLPRGARGAGLVRGMFAAGHYEYLAPGARAATAVRGLHHRIERALLRRAARHADLVLAISASARDAFAAATGTPASRLRVLPWGVAPCFAAVARAAPPERVRRIVFFASPSPRKGARDAIAACARLRDPGWQLTVVWQHTDRVAAWAEELGVAGSVRALAPLDQEALAGELATADLALLPSSFESFGLACAEAQSSGLAVVAYDVGGVREVVVPGETGWLAPVGRVDLLVAALQEAVDEPERTFFLGLAGRARAARFCWQQTACTLLGWLAELREPGNH